MWAGRTSLKIDLPTMAKKLHHQIGLNTSFRSGLLWWDKFLEDWNSVSVLRPAAVVLTSNASGVGLGSVYVKRRMVPVAVAEVMGYSLSSYYSQGAIPIVVVCAIWGTQ